ncbi:hypothetical protein PFICI_10947 [Pestalotiopsis fici W106-1]|uniref:Chitin-binding type-4 domain-containing protein n=1 Tax=Pestalotiopsis fici (strain W106-1 / CGMCC3.15140) TaxID=1229662 RepID=W3WT73_PESFW|nr:uncharacterized protein PFICI_10947 [Pestalotiopsis fici W106-1]ETS77073.1 hypothetical protein PFICI_10947 [Pestalotiopsis fici W106-1]
MFTSNVAFVAAGLVAAVNGHMQLSSPQPHTFLANDGQKNPGRPLDSAGSDFPCRNPNLSFAWDGPLNTFALGSQQQLALIGSAVHGGGSCQLSITYDREPTADSVFKVIHTVQGGCPARNTEGNLGDDASMTDPFTYDYTIPDNIPAGNATIAWSWLNRVGNREFYMECGVLELTGEGGDQANFDALPDLFVANIDPYSDGCSTLGMESEDPIIPNPGDSVETNSAYSAASFTATCGSLTATGGSGSSPTSYAASSAQATSAVATSVATSEAAATSSAQGGVFITKTAASSASQATTTAQATTKATSVAVTTSAAAATTTASSSGSTSGQQKSGACDTDGVFNCLGSSYQQCASGQWSAVMQMAAGTECTVGESTDMAINAVGRKMIMRALKN